MNESNKYGLLVLITTPKLAEKVDKLLVEENIPIINSINAQGTATSEIMDMFGLGNADKKIVVAALPQTIKKYIFERIHQTLKFNTVNSGIAFSIPITGSSNIIPHMFEGKVFGQEGNGEMIMSDNKFSLIVAMVNRGYTVEVMEAAKEAGASGGSVINSRRIANEEVCSIWGLSAQEEKEIVLIVSDEAKKVDIMSHISKSCGMHSEAKGIVLSLGIDSVMGISGKKSE